MAAGDPRASPTGHPSVPCVTHARHFRHLSGVATPDKRGDPRLTGDPGEGRRPMTKAAEPGARPPLAGQASRSGDELLELAQQGSLGARSDDRLHDLAALVDVDGRDAVDPV